MSLNGLDAAAVKEAYEAAVAEPGGWFLLKYTSRDEVDVLAKGNGGTVDMRNNIAQYEETSPLFGLLRYRRRNVIIKYLPEGCSRLIQARLAVHFNAVCERFAPYDTTFDIAEAKELKDTKLSAACSLHTASESASSSTSSLRRRRLMEIAEEEEGEQRTAKRQSTVEEEEDHQSDIDPTESRPRSPITGPPVTLDPQLAFARSITSFETDTGRRLSSQSSRQDYYSSSSYYNKPRVKLGPRPSIDPAGKQGSSGSVRPVASMPASLKLSFKGAKRTKTQDDSSSVISEEPGDNAFLTPTTPLPGDSSLLQALRPRTSGGRPSTSSGVSVKSLPSISAPSKNTMTPEKLRLMKAMQLREKKKMASAQPPPVPSVQVTADPEEAETAVEKPETRDETQTSAENDQAVDHLSLTKIESEGDNSSTIPTDHASVRTQTDSRPPSPICASSEVGDSTKASSVSDSTEETIQGQGDKNEQEHENNTGSAQEADTLKQDDARPGEAPAAGPDDAGIESGPGVEGQEVSQAPLTQTEQQPDTEDAQREAMNGQAVVEPMGPDPHEVTSVPGRIDEVGPAPVDPAAERTQDGSAASPPKWNLPISKYSTHDSSKNLAPSPIPAIVTSSTDTPDGDHQDLANAADTMEAESASSEKRSKRPEPINTDLDLPDKQPVQEDGQPAGEPQSATTQEAKPVIIASPVASPVTATSQGQPSEPPTPRIMRTVSSPIQSPQKPTPGAGPPSARSVSQGAAFHSRMNQQSASHLGPRPPGKLSGGLASRIKAFEQLATKPPSPGLPVVSAKDRPSSAFFSVRKNSIRDGAQSPAALERANSVRGRSPGNSLETSPEAIIKPSRERSGSVASRLSVFEGGNAPRGRPESISVTARIVRDPGPTLPRPQETPHDHESSPLELRQSPLIVDHRKGAETPELEHIPDAAPPVPTPLVHAGEPQPRKSLQERRLSKAGSQAAGDEPRDGHRPGQRTSLTMARDFLRDSMVGKDAASTPRPLSMHQHHTSLMGRLSISSKRTSFGPDAATSPVNPLSPTSTGELSESGDDKKSKEGNRASRFMRRLSSSLSPRKQSTPTISPTLAEESVADVEKATPPRAMTAPSLPTAAPLAASLGDVNVQFPDNLLWKRRTVSLDTIGYLLLNAVQGVTSIREKQLKRYHLSEFKPPYAPEIEFQELPNSVCLDFIDGSSLQIAFQDRAGQLNGLHTLQENHKKHISSAS
ncbi:hypothetical protein INS49_005960 [Diaporthe citri]|uniref:uncharacterized protein n=1 Tax=Diaporthe citri TaxID=83186 RepID=UPI001C7F47B3|nr:uncharacterized protein INS49_005960 [Diaporthe citri]KAG6364359.1 hypothetical protein INS49_005960 [Diaporthe citri]